MKIITPARMATLALAVVGLALTAQIAFNLIMSALGADYPYTYFMFKPDDRWADFFKLIFTYPGRDIHAPYLSWPFQDHITYLADQAYEHAGGLMNPDHLPPLSTLIAVLGRFGFSAIDPVVLFFALFALGVVALGWSVNRFMAESGARWRWTAFAILSYPVIFTLDRGHTFALICGLTLILGCWRMIGSGRIDLASLLLLAIAINLRPNVAVVPALLILSQRTGRLRDLPYLGIASAALLLVAMAAAHALYPYYGWATWLRGLDQYHEAYIVMPINHGFTASVPTALELMLGYAPWIAPTCLALGALLGLATLTASRWDRIGTAQVVFLGLALMPVMTPAFTEYHLMPFLLPPLLIAANGGVKDRSDLAVFLASLALLIPKNYAYEMDEELNFWSYQIFANPAIVLAGALFVLGDALIGQRSAAPRPSAA